MGVDYPVAAGPHPSVDQAQGSEIFQDAMPDPCFRYMIQGSAARESNFGCFKVVDKPRIAEAKKLEIV
jgi:hypothetical protein